MRFTEWLNELLGLNKIDSKTEKFIEEAEKIKPEKPLDYDNETEDLGISSEGSDL